MQLRERRERSTHHGGGLHLAHRAALLDELQQVAVAQRCEHQGLVALVVEVLQ